MLPAPGVDFDTPHGRIVRRRFLIEQAHRRCADENEPLGHAIRTHATSNKSTRGDVTALIARRKNEPKAGLAVGRHLKSRQRAALMPA